MRGAVREPIRITDEIFVDDREVEERFVLASGPGGQNVNKVATAVELRFNVRRSSLPPDVKQRLIAIAGRRMTADGSLRIDSREHRTQGQNREAARGLVALRFFGFQATGRGAREETDLKEAARCGERAAKPGTAQ